MEDSRVRYQIQIRIDGEIAIKAEGLTKDDALACLDAVMKSNPDNEFLQRELPDCIRMLGIKGVGDGKNSIMISGGIPIVYGEMSHVCKSRPDKYKFVETDKIDRWDLRGDDLCCSFCGSIHPDRLLELVRIHGFDIILPTDKFYKLYVRREGVINAGYGGTKYYRWHDTPEFKEKYEQLKIDELMKPTN